jgi:hypothetical protein
MRPSLFTCRETILCSARVQESEQPGLEDFAIAVGVGRSRSGFEGIVVPLSGAESAVHLLYQALNLFVVKLAVSVDSVPGDLVVDELPILFLGILLVSHFVFSDSHPIKFL